MRLRELTLRGVSTAFKQSTVVLPFDDMPAGLIALVGDNGSGKTTLLEASGPLTLYRKSPSYDESFADRIVPGIRDAFVVLTFSLDGETYTATVRADPLANGGRGKTEATLVGDSQTCGPLVREFDAAVLRILPSEEVMLASAFAAQGGIGSFFTMSRQERRDVLAVLLGLGRLQTCAEAAQANAQAAQEALARVTEAVGRQEAAVRLQADLELEAGKLRAQAADADSTQAARQAEVDNAQAGRRMAGEIVAGLEVQLAAPVVFQHHEDAIEAASQAAQEARQAVSQTQWTVEKAAQAHAEVVRRHGELLARHQKLGTERARLEAEGPPGDPDALEVERQALAARIEVASRDLDAAEAHLTEVHKANAAWALDAGARKRDTETAALLDRIPGVPACEGCVLTADARAARDRAAVPLPSKPPVAAARQEVERLRSIRTTAQVDEAKHGARILRASRYVSVCADIAEITGPLGIAGEAVDIGKRTLADAETAHTGAAAESTLAESALRQAQAARNVAVEGAKQAVRVELNAARSTVAEWERSLATHTAQRDEAARLHRVALKAQGEVEGRLAAATEAASGLATTQAEQARRRVLVADWTLTARVLGRDGAQALAIDAAGPGISRLANDLLSACYGDRFQLRFVTSEPKKSGDGWKEIMDVQIFDAEQGRVARRGSGGEMVVLDEALRLAIALYNAQTHGFPCQTLWRDETAGALSPEHADRYVKLLRRARELGGFHHVLFIAHAPDVWKQADTQVFVDDGRVTIRAS